jgi:uncharacterized membrane protein YkoI
MVKKNFLTTGLVLVLVILMLSFVGSLSAQKVEKLSPKMLASQAKIKMEEAAATALKEAPGYVLKAELEKEKGKLIYSFDILPSATSQKITEVQIEAITGQVVSKAEENISGKEEEEKEEAEEKGEKKSEEKAEKEEEPEVKELISAVRITFDQAIKIARQESPGFVLSAELEKEKGQVIYSFDILPDLNSQEINEIQVNVTTGKIAAKEKEKIK